MGLKAACLQPRSSSPCSSTCLKPRFSSRPHSSCKNREKCRIPATLLCLLTSSFGLLPFAYATDKKLTDEDRVELLRGLTAEFATVKSFLPRSKKPLPFESNGTWDK